MSRQKQSKRDQELISAIFADDHQRIGELLRNGADPNAPSQIAGRVPIMEVQSVEAADLLIEAGANVNAVDTIGYDVLDQLLFEEPDESIIERLVEAGANLNRRAHGETRAHHATFFHNEEALNILLKLGARLETDYGTLLSAASWASSGPSTAEASQVIMRIIDLLVAAGELVDAMDAMGQSALHCAVRGYSHAPTAEEWNSSSDGPNAAAAAALLRHGADPNLANLNGKTPMVFAAQARYGEDCLRELLKGGAELDLASKNEGMTPLMWAAASGLKANVELLLAAGADLKSRDGNRYTALDHARIRFKDLDEETVIAEAAAEFKEADVDEEMVPELMRTVRQQFNEKKGCLTLLEEAWLN